MTEKKYSQSNEDLHIVNYFNNFKGNLLSIGENDGKTFSNALALIELGWNAVLVEPSPTCFDRLMELHKDSKSHVRAFKCAIGNENTTTTFYESGKLPDPNATIDNYSLVSSLNEVEKKRWDALNLSWVEYPVDVITYESLCKSITPPINFDFISIDCEGLDLDILKQIDLINTKLVCIEYNSIDEIKNEIVNYCSKFGLINVIYQNAENILIGL